MWRTLCPMLDGLGGALPSLVRPVGRRVLAEPIGLSGATLALGAFELFSRWVAADTDLSSTSARYLMASEGMEGGIAAADAHDSRLMAAIARNMAALGDVLGTTAVPRIRVALPPCGVLEAARSDCIWDSDLVEFKAVRRHFGVRDLRQVILYGALARLVDEASPTALVLANPVRAVYIRFEVDELATVISGEPFDAVSRDIADYLVGLGISG